MKSKWKLALAPYKGLVLFGEVLDPILIENKDKQKVLPGDQIADIFRTRKGSPFNLISDPAGPIPSVPILRDLISLLTDRASGIVADASLQQRGPFEVLVTSPSKGASDSRSAVLIDGHLHLFHP